MGPRIEAALLGLALVCARVGAEPVTVEWQVVGPGGDPLAGVRVVLRAFELDRSLRSEEEALTDDEGRFSLSTDVVPTDSPDTPTAYLLVDAPGLPVTVWPVPWHLKIPTEPLRLAADEDMVGRLTRGEGESCEGAEVAVASVGCGTALRPLYVNAARFGVRTDCLVARADASGEFRIRPVHVYGPSRHGANAALGALQVRHEVGEGVWFGERRPIQLRRIEWTGRHLTIHLFQGRRVVGRVVSKPDGKPVPRAAVRLRRNPSDFVATLTTDDDGRFASEPVWVTPVLWAVASHPDYADGVARVRIPRGATEPDPVEIGMRPWVNVSGRVIEEATGGAPVAPVTLAVVYGERHEYGDTGYRRDRLEMTAAPDGTFSARLPAGSYSTEVKAAGYHGRTAILVPPEGVTDLELVVRRLQGILLRIDYPGAVRDLLVRIRKDTADRHPAAVRPSSEFVFLGTKERGGVAEVQITRGREVLSDWLLLAADSEWPVTLTVEPP